MAFNIKKHTLVLASVAKLVDVLSYKPRGWQVWSSGAYRRQPADISLSHARFSLSLKSINVSLGDDLKKVYSVVFNIFLA